MHHGFETDGKAGFERTLARLRAAGEPTRLRLLLLLDRLDLTVSDLTSILGQSQPRISRHLKLLVDAGLVRRHQEGAWAYFRAVERGPAHAVLAPALAAVAKDEAVAADLAALEAIREARAKRAAAYFSANAAQWGAIRAVHIEEEAVEAALLELGLAATPRSLLDLGTGTGRMLQLFAPHIERGLGLDTSRDMLAVARSALENDGHEAQLAVRPGDVYDVAAAVADEAPFDLVVLHQVLHFLEDPAAAFRQAAARMAKGGHLLVVDFAPHEAEFLRDEHAHRRLGVDAAQLAEWLEPAGLVVTQERALPPPAGDDASLTVMVWLIGRK